MHGLHGVSYEVHKAQGTVRQTGVRYLGTAPVMTYQGRCTRHGYVGKAGTWGHAATEAAVHRSTCEGTTEVLGVCPNCQQARWPARYGHRDCLHDCAHRGLAPMPAADTLYL